MLVYYAYDQVSDLFVRRLKFTALDGVLPRAGRIFDVWENKNGQVGSTKIFTASVGASGQQLREVDAAALVGMYEIQFTAADLDTVGAMSIRILDVGGGGDVTEEMHIHFTVQNRTETPNR